MNWSSVTVPGVTMLTMSLLPMPFAWPIGIGLWVGAVGVVMGHEIAGEVVEVGSGVSEFSPGDRVASFNFQSCGRCSACRKGRPSLCRQALGDIGQVRDGGYAEYTVLPRANLVRVPDGLPLEHACLAACAYAPPYKAIRRVGQVRPGQTVVITGASGGLGIAAIQIARPLNSGIGDFDVRTAIGEPPELKLS